MQGPAAQHEPSAYRLTLPEAWVSFELNTARRSELRENIAAELRAQREIPADFCDRFAAYCDRVFRDAWEMGIVGGAGYFAVIEGEPPEPVIATLTTAIASSPAGAIGTAELHERLGRQSRGLATVDLHLAKAGTLVRRSSVREIRVDAESGAAPHLIHQYFAAKSESSTMAIMTFQTPALEFQDEFKSIFDLIAGSFEWVP